MPEPEQGAVGEDDVEARSQSVKRGGVAAVDDLDVADAGSLQALEDRPKLELVAVVGVDLAVVLHRCGEGQRLAACACAEVEHLMAWFRSAQGRRDLAAFVLDLEPAFAVRSFGFDVRAFGGADRRRDANAVGRELCRRNVHLLEGGEDLVAASP